MNAPALVLAKPLTIHPDLRLPVDGLKVQQHVCVVSQSPVLAHLEAAPVPHPEHASLIVVQDACASTHTSVRGLFFQENSGRVNVLTCSGRRYKY